MDGRKPPTRFACKYFAFELPAPDTLVNTVFLMPWNEFACKYFAFELPCTQFTYKYNIWVHLGLDLMVNTVL